MSSVGFEGRGNIAKIASQVSTDTEVDADAVAPLDQPLESGVEEGSNDTSQLSTSVATSQKDEETGSETPKSKPRYLSNRIMFGTIHTQIKPQDIIEYEWPTKSGERFFIQVPIRLTGLIGYNSGTSRRAARCEVV